MNKMENVNLQSTSFWDFRSKKIYTIKKDKTIDFRIGIVFALAISAMFVFFLSLFKNLFPPIYFVYSLAVLILCIYLGIKRKYLFLGIIIGFLISYIVFAVYEWLCFASIVCSWV